MPVLFLLANLPRLWVFIETGIARVGWPWQFDYAEGVNLNASYLLSQGRNIYSHNGPGEFLSAPYAPLFYLLTAPFQAITGPSFGLGRAISLLSTVVVALLISYIVWKVAGNLAASVLAGGLWLTLSPVIILSVFFKQDIPALALDLAGVAWILRTMTGNLPDAGGYRLRSAATRDIVIACLLFTLAFYMKQSAITGAVAVGLWLLIRHWRTGLLFGGLLGAMVLVPFFTVNLLLKGGLWEHLVTYHSLPQGRRRFMRIITALLSEYWPILMVGAAAIAGWLVTTLRPRKNGFYLKMAHASARGPYGLVTVYALLGFGQTLTKAGYEGASFNHTLDVLLGACVLVGLTVAFLNRLLAENRLIWGGIGWVVLAGLLVVQISNFTNPQRAIANSGFNKDKNREMQGLSKLVARTPGDMYSEDAYLLLSNGKRVVYDDASTFVPLANLNKWDDSAFNQAILDRRFSFIFLLQGNVRWTAHGMKALDDNYSLKFPGSVDAYEPRLFPKVPQFSRDCELAEGSRNIRLAGYSLPPGIAHGGAKAGETLRVQLWWQPEDPPKADYARYVHLLDAKNDRVAGQDSPRTDAVRPSTEWKPRELITDTASIPLPEGMAKGHYRLVAGMYSIQGGAIRPLTSKCRDGETYGDGVSLGWVDVTK